MSNRQSQLKAFFCKILAISSVLILSAQVGAWASGVTAVYADGPVVYEDNGQISRQLHVPLYSWVLPHIHPRGVVLAVHGLAMHGKSYDSLGTSLAQRGYVVYSIDLRGYGRCVASDHEFCIRPDCKQRINYERSFDDLTRTARSLRELYPSLPLFGVGESLGGTMMIRLAAANPELVDGIILSSPAIKHQNFMDRNLVTDAGLVIANPRKQLDLMPFARRFCSDDPRVVAEMDNDPLVRRHLSVYELMQSSQTIRKTVSYIDKVPADTPVLVIQGSADRCVKANAVMILLSRLRSVDQTVKWFHERGHILLETDYIKADTMQAVVSWLDEHVDAPAIQAKCNRTQELVVHGLPADQSIGIWASARNLIHAAISGSTAQN